MAAGNTAIIIGATSGIGRGIARELLSMGWKVGIAGRRESALAAIREEFGSDMVSYRVIDITSEDSSEKILDLIHETGYPDMYIHVAGIGFQNRSLQQGIEIDTVRTNAEGFVRSVTTAFNYYRTAGRQARIAVVSSVAGTKGMGAAPAYSATKKMQSTYISALAQLATIEGLKIRFTDIRPGFVDTDILNKQKHYPMMMSCDKAVKAIVKGLLKGRRTITVDWKFSIVTALWRLIPGCIWENIKISN